MRLPDLRAAYAAPAPTCQLLSPSPPCANAELVLVHAAQRGVSVFSMLNLTDTSPTFTPCRSLLGSAGGTTASFVLTIGTMFIRRSSCSVPLRFRRFCSSWKSKLVTKIYKDEYGKCRKEEQNQPPQNGIQGSQEQGSSILDFRDSTYIRRR